MPPPYHPPRFLPSHKLSDWPRCSIELHCCKGTTVYPVKLLMERCGDITFDRLLARLRCQKCRRFRPAPVYLCAGHRAFIGGAAADWAIELVPPPKEKPRPPANSGEAVNDDAPPLKHTTWGGGFP